MDKSIIAAGRQLRGHQYLPLVHRLLPDGYAPLVLSLMGLRVSEVIYCGGYDLPAVIHRLYKCTTPHKMIALRAVRCRDGVFIAVNATQLRPEDDFLVRVFTKRVLLLQ